MEATYTKQRACRISLVGRAPVLDRPSHEARGDFESLMHVSSYPAHKFLFSEKEPATGLYIVLDGEVMVFINSAENKRLSLRISRRGNLVGFSAVSAGDYSATPETLYLSRLAYVDREDLLAFFFRHPATYAIVVDELVHKVSVACEQLRMVTFSNSAPEKLARLLLDLSENDQTGSGGNRIRLALTHEQIGEFIDASRETVTPTLAIFKRRRLLRLEESTLIIPDRAALANLVVG